MSRRLPELEALYFLVVQSSRTRRKELAQLLNEPFIYVSKQITTAISDHVFASQFPRDL